MKVHIISQDTTAYKGDISEKEIQTFVKLCIVELRKITKKIIPDVGIIFVSSEKIASMNKKFRDIEGPTDVLSFNSEEDGYLGDVIISKKVVEEYAKLNAMTFEKELKRDMLHGIMHLLGYDHRHDIVEGADEEMFIVQENILHKLV